MTLSLRSSLPGLLVFSAAVAGIHASACSSSSSSSSGQVSSCQPLASLTCASADTGYVCPADTSPGLLACDPATTDSNGNFDYCCYSGDTTSGCAPDDAKTAVCETGATGYQCNDGVDPLTSNPSLECNEGTPDPDGLHVNFCCGPRPPNEDAGTGDAAPQGNDAAPQGDDAAPTGPTSDAAGGGD
ncbi:MAG TPA: hypothetical protein VGG39_03205 [Polyangiaceae bacterium]|jgi:hypothetical protein